MEGAVQRGGRGRGGAPGRGSAGRNGRRPRVFTGDRYLRAQELWHITHYPTQTELTIWAGYCGVTYRQLQQLFQRYRRKDRLAAAAVAGPIAGGIVHQQPPQGMDQPSFDFDIGNLFTDFPFDQFEQDPAAPQP